MTAEQSANKQSLNIWILIRSHNHKKETNNILREKNCGLSLTMLSCMCVWGRERENVCVSGIWTDRGGWCLRAVERSGQTQAAIHGQIKFMWESAPLSQPSLPSECFITSASESASSCQNGSQQRDREWKKETKKSSLPCVSSYRIEPQNPPFLNNTSAICKPDTHRSTPMSSRAAWQPKHTRVHIWVLTRLQTQTHTINIPPRLYHHRSGGLIRVTKHTSFPVTPCQHS